MLHLMIHSGPLDGSPLGIGHFLDFSFKQIHFHPQNTWMSLPAEPSQSVPPKERPCCHQQLGLGPAAAPSSAHPSRAAFPWHRKRLSHGNF